MNERDEYGFCPKCGALMQNGVCRSCGYGNRMGAKEPETFDASAGRRKRPAKNKMVVGIFVSIGILFLAAVIILLYFSIRTAFQRAQYDRAYGNDDYGSGYFGYGNPYDDSWLDDYYGDYDDYDDYDDYEPDPNDTYYKEITDATSLDLSYRILWESVSLRPDDEDDTCTYDCIYPVLTGGEDEKDRFASMNEKIKSLVCEYRGTYQEHYEGVGSYAYVTYMDEEKISVVVKHSLYEKKNTIPRVGAISFRIDTGEVIPYEDMAEIDEELVWQFRSRNALQNGTVEFLDKLSDEELQVYLKDSENSVMFYTPVGLEIGFNYDGGWVTVTLKNDAL